mgnify:CR=1 FL=1
MKQKKNKKYGGNKKRNTLLIIIILLIMGGFLYYFHIYINKSIPIIQKKISHYENRPITDLDYENRPKNASPGFFGF